MPCPASTRLMRKSTSGQQTVNVAVASTLLVPYSPTRVALIISSGTLGPVNLSLRQAATSVIGLNIALDGPPLVLTLGDHGALVMGPIFAACPGGAENVTVWDAHLPEVIEG